MGSYEDLARSWLRQDKDEQTRSEIEALLTEKNVNELENRLRRRIAFGTAGLRASMKAGFAYMNPLTVLQASHGLADYIIGQHPAKGDQTLRIVIGHDARHNSEKFARLAAAAFLVKNFHVLWLEKLAHTPLVPFAIRHLGAAAGVMVTASHNPKNDNGYKVYWSNASQIIPPHDVEIANAIKQIQEINSWDPTAVDTSPNVSYVFAQTAKAYLDSIRELVWPLPSVEQSMPFTYTPMHGVGLPYMKQIAHMLWFRGDTMHIVAQQAEPDPEFPTVPFPNPEEKGALELAIQEAQRNSIELILANDPDADRFSAAVRVSKTEYRQFTGNQLGILLASHVLETYKGDRSRLLMLASTVSSRMLAAMAAAEGFHFHETLTGFKWLGNEAQRLAAAAADDDDDNGGLVPVFAFEEAIGYMFPSVVWDKDGIAAAAVFLSAWQRWKRQGLTPWQKLQQLYQRYGHFEDANTYVISPSPEMTDRVFDDIRGLRGGERPEEIGGRKIRRWRDLTIGYDSGTEDGRPVLPVDPNAQMITCELGDVVFTVRGSGTEPKIKFYIEAKAASSEEAKTLAKGALDDLLIEWFKPEYGLKLAGT